MPEPDDRDDWRQLRRRDSAQEGIPMILGVESVGAQEDVRAALGHGAEAFAAHQGDPFGRAPVADRLIEEAGHRFVFSNLKIQRIAAGR